MRIVKHVGARSTPEDDTKVLHAVPLFPGEKIKQVNLQGYFASGDDSSIDQPGRINWYGIIVPWSLVFATNLLESGGAPSLLADVATIDDLYAQWLKEVADNGGEVWGGDVDADPMTDTGEAPHVEAALIDSGPIGVHRWFSRESIMQPFAAEGNNVIRFGDSFSASRSIPAPAMGGLALFGVVRFQVDAETNFNIQMDDTVSRGALGLLITGDYSKVQSMIEGDTAANGDYLRTVLFGGDNYIEADTLKKQAGKAHVIGTYIIDSPLSRRR